MKRAAGRLLLGGETFLLPMMAAMEYRGILTAVSAVI